MDRTDAVKELEMIQSALCADGASRDVSRALEMAIKALERELYIKVGDECRYKSAKTGKPFVVTYIDFDDGIFSALYTDGDVIADGTLAMIEKTGRHFESVERLLEELKLN